MLERCNISGFGDEISQEVEEQISLLNKLGQKYLEFRSGDGKGIASYSLEEGKQLRERLDKHGIKVSALGSPIGKIDITEAFEPHFLEFQHIVDLAHTLDTKYIRMFSFFIPEGKEAREYKEEVFYRMRQFLAYAKEKNVVLLHENEKDIYGDTIHRNLELMEEFYCDNFKMTFDFANFVQCDQDTKKAYELLHSYIEYVHIKDACGDTKGVVPAGMGDGNLKEILGRLEEKGYEGFLSLEPHLQKFSGFDSLEKNKILSFLERTNNEEESFLTSYEVAYQSLIKLIR